MEKKVSIYQLLRSLRKSDNQSKYLEEVEDKHGKDVKLDLIIADYTDRLTRKGFNVEEYIAPYKHWNSFERMKLLKARIYEQESYVVKYILHTIQKINDSFSDEQKKQMRCKMYSTFFANLSKKGTTMIFEINDEHYEVLNSLYQEKIPDIFL